MYFLDLDIRMRRVRYNSFAGTNGEIWRKEKDEAEIIPPDLKERDFKLLQPNELKTIGPKFGSNAGKYSLR